MRWEWSKEPGSYMGEQPGLLDAVSPELRRKLHDLRTDVLSVGRGKHDLDVVKITRIKVTLAEMEAERELTAPPEPPHLHLTGRPRCQVLGDHLLTRLVQIEAHEWQRCQPQPAETPA